MVSLVRALMGVIKDNPEPTAMIAFATLLSFIGVVAVAFECEVAALVFLGLAVGVARYLA